MQRERSTQQPRRKILMSESNPCNPARNVHKLHFGVRGFVWATGPGRGGVGGEWRNFAQLLRKCIVVGNPLEIEIGRGSARLLRESDVVDTHMAALHQSAAEPEKLAVATGGTVDWGQGRGR